ncbi:MAG: hydroxyacid dehydrogenase [Acidiferrobacterales bacterium]
MPLVNQPRVLLIGSMYDPAGEELLARHTQVEVLGNASEAAIRDEVRTAFAAFVRYPSRLGGDAIRTAADLLVISTSGRGTDAVDIEAATTQGIAVVNNPGLGSVPVSEHTMGLMLSLAKRFTHTHGELRRAKGWGESHAWTRIELQGRTLGVIGCGQIGTEVARKGAAGFGMRVLVYDPYIPPAKAEAVGATWLEELTPLLRKADFVSLHPELTEETRGMIGEPELRQMRRDAFLINTARGAIVQTSTLVCALTEGWIAGAALDVFDPEPPPPDSALYELDNLILSPHVAGLTLEARRELALSAANQILQVLRGERPPHLVNPEAWERVESRLHGRHGAGRSSTT